MVLIIYLQDCQNGSIVTPVNLVPSYPKLVVINENVKTAFLSVSIIEYFCVYGK